MGEWKNKLYFGDNLRILRDYIPDESVDLIYLDPPFNSTATYNVLFKEPTGEHSQAQITAFDDTWHWGSEAEAAFHDVVTKGPKKLADLLQALRTFLGQNDMMAYLVMMAPRLVELHRVLKPTGSIYLHCDPRASHYIKLLLDAVFGTRNYRNEIVWCYEVGGRVSRRGYGRRHQTIFFYTKGDDYVFNWQDILTPWSDSGLEKFRYEDEKGKYRLMGRFIKGSPIKGHRDVSAEWERTHPELVYRHYLKEGRMCLDYWNIAPINQASRERLGYPTQKPEALLERIIRASSNEGGLVLDPFCGCGTAIAVAERLHRRWIGIDITHLAIALMRHRLHDSFGSSLSEYEVIGDPTDPLGARALAHEDRFKFEWWALGHVGARPAQDKRKRADSGIDGYINFFDDNSGKAKTIIVQVKSGHVTASQVRDLKGVLEREKAAIGAFITLEEPTRPMREEAASAGFYEPPFLPGQRYPRIQILTIEELFEGKKLLFPDLGKDAWGIQGQGTFKRARRQSKVAKVQGTLDLG